MATATKPKSAKAPAKPKKEKATPPVSAAAPETRPEPPPVPAGFDPRKLKEVAGTFNHISDGTRLHAVLLLDKSPTNVGDIAKALGVSQPAVSHHLALMRHARVIESNREGKHNFYELTELGQTLAKCAKEFMA